MKVLLLMPALNEAKTVGRIVTIAKRYIPDVLVVDDGSRDATSLVAARAGAIVERLGKNMGKGRALMAGFAYALANDYGSVMTMDADGQHDANHRMYFPFVGLVLAVSWPVALWIYRRMPLKRSTAVAFTACGLFLVSASIAATRHRNTVWKTDESLWLDVTIKSPKNGRGLMNYGLTQMEKGRIQDALNYFERAAAYTPNYCVLEINRGIAKSALKNDAAAEQHFQRAIALAPREPFLLRPLAQTE